MPALSPHRVGYVLKMYPRFSETFIVNEMLAHEAAGYDLDIFSLRSPSDGRFHEALARVRAQVIYLPYYDLRSAAFWEEVQRVVAALPNGWAALEEAVREDVRDVFQALLLAQQARARGITHLHAHFGSTATTVARLAARLAGISYSFTAHAKDLFHESVQPDDLRRKLNDATAVITVSDFNVHFLRGSYAADNVVRVYNGLPLDQFRYDSPAARPPTIVSVGRLIEKKGFGDLIAACALLKQQGRTFRCVIVGAGPLEAQLRSQIAALDVGDCVELPGPRPQGEVIRLVQAAAVFAAPCVIGTDGNRDGLPTVLLEAMALGTPCVSTDVTGIPEVLHDGATGLMVPQHDPSALAAALARLLDQPQLRVRLAENARRLIEAQFDIEQNAARVRAVFDAPYPAELHAEVV